MVRVLSTYEIRRPVGVDFRNYIKRVFDSCDVLLAVIGPDWMGDDGTGKTRLEPCRRSGCASRSRRRSRRTSP